MLLVKFYNSLYPNSEKSISEKMKIISTYSTPNEYITAWCGNRNIDAILLTERIIHVAVNSVVVFSASTQTIISSVIVTVET